MHAIRVVLAKVRALFRRDVIADEIREELQFHLEMRADEYARAGLDPLEARREALRRFGNPAVLQDRGYDVRGGGVIETIVQDVRYGIRQLRRQPSFSIVAILTLASGIGVSTALFSVIDAALLRPLPYPHPEELIEITLSEIRPAARRAEYAPSLEDIRIWRSLSNIVAHAGTGWVKGFMPPIVDTGTLQRLVVAEASEDFLETYGISPILGRSIQAEDTREGAPRVALLGHAFWQRQFGGDVNVVGRVLHVQNEPVTIIGVLPRGFFSKTAVWQAMQKAPALQTMRGSGTPVIARLRPGVTIGQATAALEAVTPRSSIEAREPAPARVQIASMYDEETGPFHATIQTLALAVGVILLIACVNVAGLTLARGASRDVELAIRASIGAGRGRLARQLLTESLLLALAGAALGVLLAYASLDSLVTLIPLSLPANSPVTINATVLAFTLALTVVTAVLFGLVPAVKLSRGATALTTVLAAGGRSGAPLSKRAGQCLIAIEVTVALILVSGSGLILRSFARLVAVDLGFDTANVLTLEVEPLDQSAPVRRDYYPSLADALRRLPQVAAAGAIDQLALTGGAMYRSADIDTGAHFGGPQRTVLPGYFEALNIRPIGGRTFQDADRRTADTAIINATAARQHFVDSPMGHTVRFFGKGERPRRIVGVVPDVRHGRPEYEARPEIYVLPNPADTRPMTQTMVMRLRDGASLPIDQLKQIASAVGPRVLVGEPQPVTALVREQVATPRNRTLLLTMLGAFGLALTLVGIFSMTAYAVARRTREIGVRVALGARPGQVVGVMVRDAAWPVALGITAGLAGTYYATRLIASFLFQVEPHDPATLAAVVIVLGVMASLAAWLPARRAAAIDPLSALRAE
jgi:putative ABC transport system permease protein